jgi:hypothetical protein
MKVGVSITLTSILSYMYVCIRIVPYQSAVPIDCVFIIYKDFLCTHASVTKNIEQYQVNGKHSFIHQIVLSTISCLQFQYFLAHFEA